MIEIFVKNMACNFSQYFYHYFLDFESIIYWNSRRSHPFELSVNEESFFNLAGLCVNKFTLAVSLVFLEVSDVVVTRSMDQPTITVQFVIMKLALLDIGAIENDASNTLWDFGHFLQLTPGFTFCESICLILNLVVLKCDFLFRVAHNYINS